jgi:hypothetical protein
MNYLSLSLLMIAMLFQTFSKTIVFVSWEANRDFISKNLCENRNRPMMHCNGKCHLRKQLEAGEQKDGNPLPSSIKSFDEIVVLAEENHLLQFPFAADLQQYYPEESIAVPVSPVHDIFHPPTCSA